MQAHGHDQQSLYSFQASTLNANSYMVTTAEHGLAALASKLKEDKWDLVDPEASDPWLLKTLSVLQKDPAVWGHQVGRGERSAAGAHGNFALCAPRGGRDYVHLCVK